mgnify:CR=1
MTTLQKMCLKGILANLCGIHKLYIPQEDEQRKLPKRVLSVGDTRQQKEIKYY